MLNFFLNSRSEVVELDLIEISHSGFSQTYRLVRNDTEGVTVTLETEVDATFAYCPIKLKKPASTTDLDFKIEIEIGDVGEIIAKEVNRLFAMDALQVKPAFIYRSYRSDDLTEPMFGPVELEISKVTLNKTGATFTAEAKTLNLTQTGELYTIQRFPMMRGFVD